MDDELTEFLSTLSLRRATLRPLPLLRKGSDFYPRSPCGERRHRPGLGKLEGEISIHALLAESDGCSGSGGGVDDISIHALLAESDLTV